MGGRCCRWHARKVGALDESVYDIGPPPSDAAKVYDIGPPPSDAAKTEVLNSGRGLAGFLDAASQEEAPRCPMCGPLRGGVLELRSSVNVDNLFGWYCDNFHVCGESESSGAGRWRWSCQCCQRDYCRKCYSCFKDGGDLATTIRDMEIRELDALDGVKAATLDLIQLRNELHGIPLPPTDWVGEVVEAPLALDQSMALTKLPVELGLTEQRPLMLPPLPASTEGTASQEAPHAVKPRDTDKGDGQTVHEADPEATVDAATGETAAFLTELMRRPKLPDQYDEQHLLERLMLEHRLRIDGFSVGEICESKAASGKWWPVIITAKHPDGTYAVDVDDAAGGKWPVVYRENLRRTTPQLKLEPEKASQLRTMRDTLAQAQEAQCEYSTANAEAEQLEDGPTESRLPDASLLQNRLDKLSSELAAERHQAAAQLAAVKNEHAAEIAKLKAGWEDEHRHVEAELRAEAEGRRDALVCELVAARSRADLAIASLAQIKDKQLKDLIEEIELANDKELEASRSEFVKLQMEAQEEVDEMKLADLEKQKSELKAEVDELVKQNVALEADLATHKTKVGQTQAELAAAKASDAAKSDVEAKLVALQKQKADLEADLASHRDKVDEAASAAASALKAATASDSARTLAEAELAELKRQNAALEADLANHKIKAVEANSALSAAATSDLAKAAAETKVAALEKQKAELEADLAIHQGRAFVAAARAASVLEAANSSNAAKADAEEKLAELERQKAALEEQARSNTRACRSLELAHKRLAEDEGQMFLRLCFKSWALIRCVHGPLKLKEEVPPCLEVEPKASSSCASQPKDADFHAPLAAVHSRARRLEAELVAVTARIALKQEEVQEALNSAEQVRMQERKQGSQVHSDAEKLQASQQKDASIAVEQAHIGRAASVALSEQGAASGAVVCEQHNFLEVFVTYASGFASSSRLSMKLGCGRRKEALMATMQIHPLRFDLRSCFETGTKAYMNGSASLCLRTSSTLGEATVVVHPLHDRYHVCLHAPEMTSELGVGLPTDPGITEEELGTFQTPIMLDLCVRGPSAVPDAAMMSRAATQQHPYLRRHALEQYMAGLLRTMAHEQVADPCAFMREQLQALAHDPPAAPPAPPPPPPPPPPPLPLRPLPPPPDQSLGSSAAAPGGLPAGICEVSLHGAEGIPDGAVLCFTGLVQGKAAASQLLQGSVLRLPVQSGKREPLKVTVMQAEHETTLPLDPAQPHYQATLQDSPARQEIGLHVRGVNSKRLLTADAVAIGSPGKRLQVSRPRDSARQYIQSQGLITLTQELLRDVVAEQPANPYRFLLERLDGRRSFCPKGVLRGQSGKRAAAPGTAQMDHEPISLERQLEEMMALVAKVADVED